MLIASLKGLKAKNTDLAKYWQENAISVDPLQVFDITGKGGWFVGSPAEFLLKKKIETNGKPLKDWDIKINYGIKTGLNEAFIIDTATKERLCQQDPKSAEIIKPILRGRDIKRYGYKWADLWVIGTFPALKLNIDNYLAIRQFLTDFGKDRLEQSSKTLSDGTKSRKKTGNKWFETQDQIGYYKEFQKEKVVWAESGYQKFAFAPSGIFLDKTLFMIVGNNLKYIMAVCNSKIGKYIFDYSTPDLGSTGNCMTKQTVETIPIPLLDTPEKQDLAKQIEALVNEILRVKNVAETTVFPKKTQTKLNINGDATNGDMVVASTEHLEVQIDQLVYQLYDLTEEEIKTIQK